MKKLLIVLIAMLCMGSLMMANDTENVTIGVDVAGITWLTLSDGTGARTWTISADDLQGVGDQWGFEDNARPKIGQYKNLTNDAGFPFSYAIYAPDEFADANCTTNCGLKSTYIQKGIRMMVDNNTPGGFDLNVKAMDDLISAGHTGDKIDARQLSFVVYDGQWGGTGIVTDNIFGTSAKGATGVGSIDHMGLLDAAGKQMTKADQIVLASTAAGSNTATMNFALTLYPVDVARSDYQATLQFTAIGK